MQPLRLIAAFIISFSAAAIGSLATVPNIPTWYAGLEKPFFNPPNEIFGPVWTILYTLIALSLYLAWTGKGRQKRRAYAWFGAQITLNALWSLVFFGAHWLWAAVIVIALLLVAIVGTMRAFWPISQPATWLLTPYLAWVSFASLLTVSIALLN